MAVIPAHRLQRPLPPHLSAAVLDGGYDQVGGVVSEAQGPRSSAELRDAWGLRFDGSPYASADHVDLLRFGVGPVMALTTPEDPGERPWPTFPLGFLRGSELVAVWELDRTRVPYGTELVRVHDMGKEQLLARYLGPADGWLGLAGKELGYQPPISLVGLRARWRDVDLPADVVDGGLVELVAYAEEQPDGFEAARPAVWRRRVPQAEVELFELLVSCRYRGVLCRVLHRWRTEARLLVLSDRPPDHIRAVAHRVDVGTFELRVPWDQLDEVQVLTRNRSASTATAVEQPPGEVPELIAHLERHLGPIAGAWQRGPDGQPLSFQVVSYRPSPQGWTVVTTLGLSNHHLPGGARGPIRHLELMMIAGARTPEGTLAAILAAVGSMIIRNREMPVIGDQITNLALLADISPMDTLYVGRALFHPRELNEFRIEDREAQMLWLMPVSAAEADYLRERGRRAFEELMWDRDPDPTDFSRPSMLP